MWKYVYSLRPDELFHSGVPGSKWGVHQQGKWDKRAVYAKGKSAPKPPRRTAARIDSEAERIRNNYVKTKAFESSFSETTEHVDTGGKKPLAVSTVSNVTSFADASRNISIDKMTESMQAHDNEDKYRSIENYVRGAAGVLMGTIATGLGVVGAMNGVFSNALWVGPASAIIGGLTIAKTLNDDDSAVATRISIGKEQKALKRKTGEIDPITGLHYKSRPTDAGEDVKLVNPGYVGDSRYNTSNNCYACSIAYELRRRGYDATVVNNTFGTSLSAASVFKNIEARSYEYGDTVPTDGDIKYMIKDIANQGPGARGLLGVLWPMGGGHAMAYEVNADKQVIVYDAQIGKILDAETVLKDTANYTTAIRLDQCEIIPENVPRFAQ